MKTKILFFIVLSAGFIAMNSCTFEDDIKIDQGNLTVFNDTPETYEISIENIDLNKDITLIDVMISSGSNLTYTLDKGYTYRIIATEFSFNKNVKNSVSEVFMMSPYKDNTWHIVAE